MKVFDELTKRGLIAQTTGEDAVRELTDGGKAVFYIGFDPTADSLHVGHFLPLIVMRHLQSAGNMPIALVGGGTTMVGDPSGRSDMRGMMTFEQIDANAQVFKRQIGRFIDFSEDASGQPRALMVNNADWLMGLNYIEFLRDIGVHFSVNRMLSFECFKNRYENGLSFIEFNYMLMQSFDFYELYRTKGCSLQVGGDDQWGNMLAGTELIRRKLGRDANVLTIPLLLTTDGVKMGKTQKGALWLDAQKTTPFDFFQYFRNVHDDDVIPFMKRLTFVPLDEIAELEGMGGAELNPVKERLAFELTALVHGERAADEARAASKTLFATGAAADNMPTTTLIDSDLTDGAVTAADLLVKCGLASSKGDAKRTIEQGGLTVNDKKIDSVAAVFTKEQLSDGLMLRKGKKTFHRAVM
ncbi:MAG: tyrosine--tRNA ligase [Oscillospiraceae bacterium]|nr:tyrosine--tRNA ligase [Oscillospiraceae bacterium]